MDRPVTVLDVNETLADLSGRATLVARLSGAAGADTTVSALDGLAPALS